MLNPKGIQKIKNLDNSTSRYENTTDNFDNIKSNNVLQNLPSNNKAKQEGILDLLEGNDKKVPHNVDEGLK